MDETARAIKIRGCGCWLDRDDLCAIHTEIAAAIQAAVAEERERWRPWLTHGEFCAIQSGLCDCGLTKSLDAVRREVV